MPTFSKRGGKTTATFKLDDRKLKEIIKNVGNVKTQPWIIHDDVEYGVYLEFGTSRGLNPRPTLRPAWEVVTRDLPEAIGQAVELGIDPNILLSKAAFDIKALWQANIKSRDLIDTSAFINGIEAEPKK